ncbi:MAG: hypothetical protein HZB25_00195 [Candidatus Eisenbacteria bacterium]|nr:hypothetical protein [Candidatus Eisenbacteria bacterium]
MRIRLPASRPDFRRIGVVAGAAFVACAAVLAAGYLVDRQADELSAASQAKARRTHRIGRIAPRLVTVAAPKGSAKATEATIVASTRGTQSAVAAVSKPGKPGAKPAAGAVASLPAKPAPAGAPNLMAASLRVIPQANSEPGGPAPVKAAPAGGAKTAPAAVAKPAVSAAAHQGPGAPVIAAKPAAPAGKPAQVAAASKPAPFWMFWKQATRTPPAAVARPEQAAAPKASARKVVAAGMVAGGPPSVAAVRRQPVPAAEGATAQPAQALQPSPEDDFGIALPLPSQYAYNPDDRRDPFQSLLKGEFQAEQGPEGQPLVDVADLSLMGVMAAGNERYAMVEDSKHHGFTLRVGDPVINGRVTRIEDDCLTVNLSSYGETQTVRLHLSANRNPKVGGRR